MNIQNKREEAERIEADRKRMQLFVDLIDESYGREKTLESVSYNG